MRVLFLAWLLGLLSHSWVSFCTHPVSFCWYFCSLPHSPIEQDPQWSLHLAWPTTGYRKYLWILCRIKLNKLWACSSPLNLGFPTQTVCQPFNCSQDFLDKRWIPFRVLSISLTSPPFSTFWTLLYFLVGKKSSSQVLGYFLWKVSYADLSHTLIYDNLLGPQWKLKKEG